MVHFMAMGLCHTILAKVAMKKYTNVVGDMCSTVLYFVSAVRVFAGGSTCHPQGTRAEEISSR